MSRMTEGTASNKYFGGIGRLSIVLMLGVFAGFTSPAQAAPFAYITNSGSNTVSVIDTATNTVVATVAVGSQPLGVAVTPNGAHVYVTNHSSSTVSVIDTATNTVVATVPVGSFPRGVAVTPDGKHVYVANPDYGYGTLSVIDTATNTVTATVFWGGYPRRPGGDPGRGAPLCHAGLLQHLGIRHGNEHDNRHGAGGG